MPPTNQQFITLDDKIISFDLNDLQIHSYDNMVFYHNAIVAYEWKRRINEGSFSLKLTDLRIIKDFIPKGCLQVVDILHTGGSPVAVLVKPDIYYALNTFELAIYEGDQTKKETWNLIYRLSRCRFDICIDKKVYGEWLTTIPVLPPMDSIPHLYELSGIFEQGERSSADCEVNS